MNQYKDGDPYVNDARVVEYFHKFDSKVGTMGGWGYDEKLLEEHATLIAEHVFDWSPGRHYHDQCGSCRNIQDVKDMYLCGTTGGLFEELVDNVGNTTIQTEYVELPKGDPLQRKYHLLRQVTVNGHVGASLNDYASALWHALVNMAIANKAKAEAEKCTD